MIVNELDVRLSAVERWPVSLTIRRQSVAAHSLNVAMIAERIAIRWFGIEDPNRLFVLLHYAMYHDYDESYTGDIPSYMKKWVLPGGQEEFESIVDEDIDIWGGAEPDDVIRHIVKFADYVDAAVFLRVEISMGNKTVTAILHDLEKRMREFCRTTKHNNVPLFKGCYSMYEVEVLDKLFNSHGQLIIEGFRF